MSVRQVAKCIKRLIELGLILAKKTLGCCNLYQVLKPSEWSFELRKLLKCDKPKLSTHPENDDPPMHQVHTPHARYAQVPMHQVHTNKTKNKTKEKEHFKFSEIQKHEAIFSLKGDLKVERCLERVRPSVQEAWVEESGEEIVKTAILRCAARPWTNAMKDPEVEIKMEISEICREYRDKCKQSGKFNFDAILKSMAY